MSQFTNTALIIIDPQLAILGRLGGPHSAGTVVANIASLGQAMARNGGAIALVRAGFSKAYSDAPQRDVDSPMPLPPGDPDPAALDMPAPIAALVPDISIIKRQWSAFFGTELDLQLRRRHIETLVICGVVTNFGVESTARDAWQLNYRCIIAEDAVSSFTPEMHRFSVETVLPRIAHLRPTAAILTA